VAWLAFSIPGGVLLLIGVACWEKSPGRQHKRSGTPISATYVNELTAMFYGTKRIELDHRDSVAVMRDEDAQGAPPRLGVDLDAGVATLRPGSLAAESSDRSGSLSPAEGAAHEHGHVIGRHDHRLRKPR
jgi:hypothetical protein